MSADPLPQAQVLGVRIDAVGLAQCVDRVARWAAANESQRALRARALLFRGP